MLQRPTEKRWVELPNSAAAMSQYFYEHGWTDGLPIIPPTEEAVRDMCRFSDRAASDVVGKIPPRWGKGTIEKVAVNAVMAGCESRYFPVIVHALEAMLVQDFGLYSLQTTTHPVMPLVVVNGPIAREIGMNTGFGVFGPGNKANATIGRAIQLCLRNIGGAIPGQTDMATQGQPSKYTFCIAENEVENPWGPLHVERGLQSWMSSVSVFGVENPHNVNNHEAVSAEGILASLAGSLANPASNNAIYWRGEVVVALGPEHAATIAREGYSKSDVKKLVYEKAWIPLERFSKEQVSILMKRTTPERLQSLGNPPKLYPVHSPDDLVVIVAGGSGKHSALCPSFAFTQSQTRPFVLKDGTFVQYVKDYWKNSGQ